MMLVVPRPYADGHQEPLAVAVVDVSDVVFPGGHTKRAREAEARRQTEQARSREIEAEREAAHR